MKTSTDLITLGGPAMGARWTARLAPGPDLGAIETALAAAVAEVEAQMTTWRDDSDLMRLNRAPVGEWVPVPPHLMQVLTAALRIGDESGGVFDIGVGGLVRAWGFGPARGHSDTAVIRRLLGVPLASARRLELDPAGGRVRKAGEVELDLSGIAKGYGVDELTRVAAGFGVTSCLLGIDGEMRALGCRPDGAPWAVVLEDPASGRRAARGVIGLADRAVATSGDYRHFVRVGDSRLAHTMNPATGGPVQNRLSSVSVLADTCMAADAWATVLMVLGEEAGPAFARARGIEAIFLIREGETIREVITSTDLPA
ncbi:FAD:protein FMN transferase [Paracoccaceae bacterium Fryx2]|nr:FAD:protein FMN transferase [Paracoccaceae bacterium Fryx2]